MQADRIIDGFAGPRGWSEGLRLIGLTDVGIELDHSACLTAVAAGHRTIEADITSVSLRHLRGTVAGTILSPPCTAFSQAGKGAAMAVIDRLIAQIDAGDWTPLDGQEQPVWLCLEVGRWVEECEPRWVACELTPSALPVWEAYERWLGKRGYSTWSGVLNAADYGVPQTRKRAFLMASLDRRVSPPPASHAEAPEPSLFGASHLPWVTMAQALGWGLTDRAAYTFCGGNEGGFELVGGSGARAAVAAARADGRWEPREGGDPGTGERIGLRSSAMANAAVRDIEEPAPTVLGSWDNGDAKWVVRTGPNSATVGPGHRTEDWRNEHKPYERSIDRPAPTLDAKVGGAWKITQLNTGRDWKPGGTRDDAQTVSVDAPAPALTAKSGGQWQWRDRRHDQAEAGEVDPDWPLDRPATTVAGRDIVADPGANANRFNGNSKSRNDGYRVEPHEAAILQSFPADYPWQGNRSKVFQQIGNAVPPYLAAAVIGELTGVDWHTALWGAE